MGLQKIFRVVVVYCILTINCLQTDARICKSTLALNHINSLEYHLRGCTIVVGNVFIALHEFYSPHYDRISFPELTEITGYLAVYRFKHLTSIGNLFPNLAVIRGDNLLGGYALSLYDLSNLNEINLYNLRHIEVGSVIIQDCPVLCYVDSIDWSKIVSPTHSMDYFRENPADCDSCDPTCNDYCWNSVHCQDIHPVSCGDNCLICDQTNRDQCLSCKSSYYLDEGKCVSECSNNTLKNFETRTCMTEDDCLSQFKDFSAPWWIFKNECTRKCPDHYEKVTKEEGWCRYCGDDCIKQCEGGIIEHFIQARELRGCTHITDSLTITGHREEFARELERSLSNIQEIDDYLEIYRITPLMSLDFLKNLKVIKGKNLFNDTYALVVKDNENLQELWPLRNIPLKIENGTATFHSNPQLCFSEIESFIKAVGITGYSDSDISRYSNGNRRICNVLDIKITFNDITSNTVFVKWDLANTDKDDTIVAYTLHYSPDPFGNVTSISQIYDCSLMWSSRIVSTNYFTISSLLPYTQYICYIEVQTINTICIGHTPLFRFRTLSELPSSIHYAQFSSTENSITVSWSPPFLNGILLHYELRVMPLNNQHNCIEERNYCLHPHVVEDKLVEEVSASLVPVINSDPCRKQNVIKSSETERHEYSHNNTENIFMVHSTKVEIASLQYFQSYNLQIKACNDVGCSDDLVIYHKTKPKPDADTVTSEIIYLVNQTNIFIQWYEPLHPNSIIVSYIIEYQAISIPDTVPLQECITKSQHLESNFSYTITGLLPARYSLKISTVTLAGIGNSSKSIEFEIIETLKSNYALTRFFVVTAAIIFIIFMLGLYYLYCFWIINKNLPEENEIQSIKCLDDFPRSAVTIYDAPANLETIYPGYFHTMNCICTVIPGPRDNQQLSEYHRDLTTLKSCEAYYVVKCLGTISTVQPMLTLVEAMESGDLKSFLRKARDFPEQLSDDEMYRMAAEISDGLMYLNSKEIIHQDLAARNCLITTCKTVKIANFGITKHFYEDDYYEKDDGELIPVRWMAPESLTNNKITYNSNLWSYGIVLWEIVTYAEQPYANLTNDDVIKHVVDRNVLGYPEGCPDLLYEMMVACWRWEPNERPTLDVLVEQLRVSKIFKLVSFYHSGGAEIYQQLIKNKRDSEFVIFFKKTAVLWKRRDNEDGDDEEHLLIAEEPPKLPPQSSPKLPPNLPSTSSSV